MTTPCRQECRSASIVTNTTEYYYVISGRGVMTLDGKRFEAATGDITAVSPGGTHGLENNADEDLRILVVSVS